MNQRPAIYAFANHVFLQIKVALDPKCILNADKVVRIEA
jgi:hypothetical protein